MNIQLTPVQAFNAMTKFLDNYYQKTLSDDIAVLLSSMQFLQDEITADPATLQEWLKIVGHHKSMTLPEAFDAMKHYLTIYAHLMSSLEIQALLQNIDSDNKLHDSSIWNEWTICADQTLHETDSRSYLRLTK